MVILSVFVLRPLRFAFAKQYSPSIGFTATSPLAERTTGLPLRNPTEQPTNFI